MSKENIDIEVSEESHINFQTSEDNVTLIINTSNSSSDDKAPEIKSFLPSVFAKVGNKSKNGGFVLAVLGSLIICLVIFNENEPIDDGTINNTTESVTVSTYVTVEPKEEVTQTFITNEIITEKIYTTTAENIIETTSVTQSLPIQISIYDQINSLKNCIKNSPLILRVPQNSYQITECNKRNNNTMVINTIYFLMENTEIFFCAVSHNNECEKLIEKQAKTQELEFNYLIGNNFHIYEGRSLSCNSDEIGNSDNLVIGIPDCEFLKSEQMNSSFNVNLETILRCSETSGLLSKDYKLEFLKECEKVLPTVEIIKTHLDRVIYL